jgi:hypothetical protein
MIEINNRDLFGKVIAESLVKIDSNGEINTAQKLRWVNAIGKAVARMEDDTTFMNWDAEIETLLILSESLGIYEANNTCQCKAYLSGGVTVSPVAKLMPYPGNEPLSTPLRPSIGRALVAYVCALRIESATS